MLSRDELRQVLAMKDKRQRGPYKDWTKQERVVRAFLATGSVEATCAETGVRRSYVWDTLSRYRCVATYLLRDDNQA